MKSDETEDNKRLSLQIDRDFKIRRYVNIPWTQSF